MSLVSLYAPTAQASPSGETATPSSELKPAPTLGLGTVLQVPQAGGESDNARVGALQPAASSAKHASEGAQRIDARRSLPEACRDAATASIYRPIAPER